VVKERVGHQRRRRRRIQEYQSQKMYQKKKSCNKSEGMSLRKMETEPPVPDSHHLHREAG
jgi:hypothetical protein